MFSPTSVSSRVATDDVPPHIKAYVDRALSRAMRDPVGRRDFALLADGARVVRALTGAVSAGRFYEAQTHSVPPPNVTLVDDLHVGNCWSMAAPTGQLGIRLSERIYPTHVTVDHIPVEIAADIGRAPRMMVLWGAIDGSVNIARLGNFTQTHNDAITRTHGRSRPHETAGCTFIPIASFEYDVRSHSHIQTFPVLSHVVDLEMYFGVVVLEVVSNWGSETTCLYRARVHGQGVSQLHNGLV
ncbi:hypothetical protein K466DRAFT_486353 [Polyporus arcularius HHB13444]|uniref:SUN domain-containing protein n=1 Tax=Polyporus arcularius HHB13444 TaxID=1314778 RepID=A0A5C3PMW5_9APHY|nr:hypothetical protein K466DRAFT_486353 [Polyporus arcularius HHB13444]